MKFNMLFVLSTITLMACSQGIVPESKTITVVDTKTHEPIPAKAVKAVVLSKDSIEHSQITKSISEDKMTKGLLTGELEASVDNGLLVSLKITNNQSYAIPIEYRSGMTADLLLLDPMGNKIWAWSNEMMFTQAIRHTVLQVGKPITVKFKIPAATMKQVKGSGFKLKAIYAGHATESKSVAMGDVTLSLNNVIK